MGAFFALRVDHPQKNVQDFVHPSISKTLIILNPLFTVILKIDKKIVRIRYWLYFYGGNISILVD
jgi:hypothetical protein